MSKVSHQTEIIAIGCSAGGFEALGLILPNLSKNFPLPVVIVLHIPADSGPILAESFAKKCQIPVREVEDKMPILPGSIYLAPANYHLMVEPTRELSLSTEEPVHYSRPSIDVLFESVAMAYGRAALGIILSGANADGSAGIKFILAHGGQAIVQDPAEADYSTMPAATLHANPDSRVMKISQISEFLSQLERTK